MGEKLGGKTKKNAAVLVERSRRAVSKVNILCDFISTFTQFEYTSRKGGENARTCSRDKSITLAARLVPRPASISPFHRRTLSAVYNSTPGIRLTGSCIWENHFSHRTIVTLRKCRKIRLSRVIFKHNVDVDSVPSTFEWCIAFIDDRFSEIHISILLRAPQSGKRWYNFQIAKFSPRLIIFRLRRM